MDGAMTELREYSSYAIMYELNSREFKKKLILFTEDLRYYVILANGIIGAENAKRVAGSPAALIKDGEEFVGKLLSMVDPGRDVAFKEILETYLVETIKDELRCCCPNCERFADCLDLENLAIGGLFKRRVIGEETEELKQEIVRQVDAALKRTPHVDTDRAHRLCKDFRHQYSASDIGEVFGRYADIAYSLQDSYGIDYQKIQQQMILLNMEFCDKNTAREDR
ncbi:MAG TPA: hypothetical protein VLD55_03855 [Candidatus Sulfobium mesophilum]|nr:hypothetical protein [Candidatus Sulfobium mesophilum]